ncbi:response regulator [Undibacterium danionis]|uniref:Response regulator n=1 Tax=Undibacterium danionis TaxID=1812100 RepID=A0ABV6IFR4_9BURK
MFEFYGRLILSSVTYIGDAQTDMNVVNYAIMTISPFHHVAVVEDDPIFRHRFEEVLLNAPDMALSASAANFPDALNLLSGQPPDVLLVDIGLPNGQSGIDLIRLAVDCWPSCVIMVLTVFGDEQNVLGAIRAGAMGYLLKDADDKTLAEHIRSLRRGESPISPVIARQLLKQLMPMPTTTLNDRTLSDTPFLNTNKPEKLCQTKEKFGDFTPTLSAQEATVLNLIAKGFTLKEVAALLDISINSVKTNVQRCYRKLQVHSQTEAIYEARRLGLIKD